MRPNNNDFMLSSKILKNIEFRTVEIFEEDGFEEIHIPILDFSPDKRALHIREDFTYEVVKLIQDKKVYYRGNIIRTSQFGKPKEIYQIGCEIVRSVSLKESDVIDCAKTLNRVIQEIEKITDQKVLLMIGHYGLTTSILKDNSNLFFVKNITKISELVSSGKLDRRLARIFFKVVKDLDEIKAVIKDVPEDIEIFSKIIKSQKVYNLSEKVEKDYYDGIIFHGFLGERKILGGGKYRIDSKEGIGFSLNLFSVGII